MKTLITFFLFSVLVFSCKTKDPSLSRSVAGTYSLYAASVAGKAATGLTGTIKLVANGAETIDATLKLTFQGQTETETISGLTVKADGATAIDIYQNADLVGTVTGNELLFYFDAETAVFEFKAKK